MILQISSGQGPQECQLVVGLLLQSLKKEYADIEVLSAKPGSGKNCYISAMIQTKRDLSELEGSILWICRSPYRPHHGRKNWYVDVSVIPEVSEISKEADYKVETLHSGGHGGQNVNKVETGVRVTHVPSGITVVCTEERSQYMNKRKAIKRIQEQLKLLNQNALANHQNDAWREHNRIIRGNPIRIYAGIDFARVR